MTGIPKGPVPIVIFSFCAPRTICRSGVSCNHGVSAKL
jgi:hypothetical protein